jgi:multidrug efflux pump subunit AcrA (membrane-fusion protein)
VPAVSAKVSFVIKFMALAVAASALAACNQITAQPAAPRRPVLVAAVHYQPQVDNRSFVGVVRPRIESDLGFRVTGKVKKRLVDVGAVVAAGQPLAVLDEVDLKLQAEQAAAEKVGESSRLIAFRQRACHVHDGRFHSGL